MTARGAWSHEVLELPGKRVIVVSETLALAFRAGPQVQGYGLKRPRYVVVVEGASVRAWGADGIPVALDKVKENCPGLPGL